MQTLSQLTEAEVILEFLKAEIDSPRWATPLTKLLSNSGYDQSLITAGDTDNESQNIARKQILYEFRNRDDKQHFQGFPDDVNWHSVTLNKNDLSRIRYMNYPFWCELSGGSRLVVDGARNLDTIKSRLDIIDHIKQTAKAADDWEMLTRIILVAQNTDDNPVLLEGHIRATAYCLNSKNLPDIIEVIIGYSEKINEWKWY